MRVLIADDEDRYRDYLRATLAEHGHEVSTVDNGRVAIDHGVRFRPNVLVADWMLNNSIHGLQVSRVLRAVDPALQTILITGFASRDLRHEAQDAGVFRFMEKPFALDEMVQAVESATAAPKAKRSAPMFALVDVDSAGNIVSANRKARRLFTDTGAGRKASGLGDLFGEAAITYLVESNERWTLTAPLAKKPVVWWARSKTWPDGAILVLLPGDQETLKDDALLRMLLAVDSPGAVPWPIQDHVIVIDDVDKTRSLCAQLLKKAGCVCYKADNHELALKLLRADKKLAVALLDYEMSGQDFASRVEELRDARPGLKIVGKGVGDHRDEFADVGIARYLDKGWDIADLVDLLTD